VFIFLLTIWQRIFQNSYSYPDAYGDWDKDPYIVGLILHLRYFAGSPWQNAGFCQALPQKHTFHHYQNLCISYKKRSVCI